MPEIWLNYGANNVVLDIKAENLENKFETDGVVLDDSEIISKISVLDFSKPVELVILTFTKSIQRILSVISSLCESNSWPKPSVFTDKTIVNLVREQVSDKIVVSEFNSESLSDSKLVFVDEVEFDGLFGFETVSTRLLKKFDQSLMLSAFEKRSNDLPNPGKNLETLQIAKSFTNSFEILAIEIVSNTKGITEIFCGHPSKTLSISKFLIENRIKQFGSYKTMIVSTGKDSSNDTFTTSLNSLWNCYDSIRNDGLTILLAECKFGIGSLAIQNFIDDRLSLDKLRQPSKYVDGMENLLFLTEIQKKFQIGFVSILPKFYLEKLNILAFSGVKSSIDYILKNFGPNQKVQVISDASRVVLRKD